MTKHDNSEICLLSSQLAHNQQWNRWSRAFPGHIGRRNPPALPRTVKLQIGYGREVAEVTNPLHTYLTNLLGRVQTIQSELGKKLDNPTSNMASGKVWTSPRPKSGAAG